MIAKTSADSANGWVLDEDTARDMARWARAAGEHEGVALLFRAASSGALLLVPAENVAPPAARGRRFEVDLFWLMGQLRSAGGAGRALVAFVHTHPGGRAWPSDEDRARFLPGGVALWPGVDLVIVATAGGRVVDAGRFRARDGRLEVAPLGWAPGPLGAPASTC